MERKKMDDRNTFRARECERVPSSSKPRSQNESTCDIFNGKSRFAFNTHFRKKSVKIKSLVEQGAIPLDMFGYYSSSTLPV